MTSLIGRLSGIPPRLAMVPNSLVLALAVSAHDVKEISITAAHRQRLKVPHI